MITCPTCGSQIPSQSTTCPVCGTILIESTAMLSDGLLPPGVDTSQELYSAHLGKLTEGQVAIYIENSFVPLIIDIRKGATIGRSSLNSGEIAPTIAVNAFDAFNKGVSRIHVTLIYQNGQVMIVDEYATNGTWLDGARLDPMKPTPVKNGSEIVLSKLRVRIFLPAP